MMEGGFNDGVPNNTKFGVTANVAGDVIATSGVAADVVNAGVNGVGSYLTVAVGGKLRIRKDLDYIGSEVTMAGTVEPVGLKIICANSGNGTPEKHSTNKIGTWIEIDGVLTITQQTALNVAVKEYNNLNSR